MANICPFKGFRYDKSNLFDLSRVVTRPYDQISKGLKKDYLQRHPANIVRIVRNSDYLEAASLWQRWIDNKTLVQDRVPSLYIYRQNWITGTEEMARTGFIGLISLDDKGPAVKGHEAILAKPLEDRLRMVRATEANEGLIYTLFSDKKLEVDHILDSITGVLEPEIDIVDDLAVRNRIWCLTSPGKINEITGLLKDKSLYIADGHHRYQTSVLYNRECAEKGWRPLADESFDKRLVAVFNMESPGLRILATHRAVRNLPGQADIKGILKKAGKYFDIKKMDNLQQLEEKLDEKDLCFGMAAGKEVSFHLFCLKKGLLDNPRFMPDTTGEIRSLDITILHEVMLGTVLDIGSDMVTSGKYVEYFRSGTGLINTLKKGSNQLGFLVKPTSLENVRTVSDAGQTMPQKSTDFFPKLLTGLVMMKMEINK